jgi:AbrB family looped-hinge helix DNA binding protein
METRRMSSRGEITIPRAILESRGWKPGQEFAVEETADGILLRPKRRFKRTKLEDFKSLKWKGKPATIKQMDEAIALEVKRRHEMGRY